MSGAISLKRQWIPMAGGSCDVRIGEGALEQSSKVLKDSVGNPRKCVAVVRASIDDATRELLRRQLVDAGYEVDWHEVAPSASCTLEDATLLVETFARQGITGDDLCCALGDASVLSLASWACGSWCGQTTLVAIPSDEVALLEGALIPRPLDVGGHARMLSVRPCARRILFDTGMAISEPGEEASLYTRALMVAGAMAGAERVFSELWDRADDIAQGELDVVTTQLLATAKSRGQASSSTAVAVRQSLAYGQDFANGLERVTGPVCPRSTMVAEGMRFAARLSVGMGKLSLDDMLAQDELMEALGLGMASVDVDSHELIRALKDEQFERGNRFMLLLPLAIGRVRLAKVPDDLLEEHAIAWCGAHA